MADLETWIDIGSLAELSAAPLQRVRAQGQDFAVSCVDGRLGVVSNVCNHVGGPLGEGRLEGDYIVCPWHYWKFHRCTGAGEPGFENDCVPGFPVKAEGGRVLVNLAGASKRNKAPHAPHPLARPIVRVAGPCGSPAFRRRRWMKPTPVFPVPTICWVTPCAKRSASAPRRDSFVSMR